MRIHGMIDRSTANGPGVRAVLHVQGCVGMSCAKDCWNPLSHDPNGGKDMSTAEILEWLGSLKDIDGLTISGGEPMQAYHQLIILLTAIKECLPNLSIGLFTGYAESELRKYPMWPIIRLALDFCVAGRYNALQPVQLPMVTSANQKLLIFRRYKREDFALPSVEVTISPTGECVETGFPVHGDIR